jgi:predicted RNase H-like nuclease (RuvC/YqgF family)|tara:strand:+ start:301 stop:471 length:171 start_codon:yes stop_codon:yes gene_type:complete
MKVYKDQRGDLDLEVQIERLKIRVRDLEDINDKHKKLNGELREELKNVRKALTRIP